MNRLRLVSFILIVNCILSACRPESKNAKAVLADFNKMEDTSNNNTDKDMYASEHDAEFAVDAAEAGFLQLELSKTALAKSSNTTIRISATTMFEAYEKTNAEITAIAKPKNIKLSAKLTVAQQQLLQNLNAKNGNSFDKGYAAQMVNNLHKMVRLMKLQAIHGMDNELTAFAKKSIPILRKQAEELERLQRRL